MVFTDGEHLVSNVDEEELHDFAKGMIKLSDKHFFHSLHFPHYELPNKKVAELAVKKGAKKVLPTTLLCEVSKCLAL